MANLKSFEELRYPIGTFVKPKIISKDLIQNWILDIESFPKNLNNLANDLKKEELNYKYRPKGWTIKQVIHHCADSHMNSFIRFKLSLTEDTPVIKPYFEDKWANFSDTVKAPTNSSLKIIEGLHLRWVTLLKSLTNNELNRTFIHPEHNKKISLKENIGIYAWHCNHHLAHIRQALKMKNTF